MMNQNRTYVLIGVVIGLVGMGLVYAFVSLRRASKSGAEMSEVVYVDTKTKKVFRLIANSSPVLHPETGKPTLVPGMYCAECKAWKPVGNLDGLQNNRGAQNCPIHKTRLSIAGP